MVAATIKFALETKKLVKKWSGKKVKESDLNTNLLDERKKNSNNVEDGLGTV